jgi:RNA polymerase sigma-70 factor (ECF subfamily)
MDSLSDIELVKLAQGGDSHAFEGLISRHYMTVYRAAYRWCGIREDAEDIAQEVFIKVARSLKTFAAKSAFTTWLYRITINTAMDLGRKNATRREYLRAWSVEPQETGSNPGDEAALEAGELYGAIAGLPTRQKAAALLVWAEGLTHKEAARVLECAEKTVSAHIFQAREKLKSLFGERL